jgi:hypothetical protein
MIQRPQEGLPPAERAVVRKGGIIFVAATLGAVVLAIVLMAAGVDAEVTAGAVVTVAAATGVYLVFGVFKLQRYSAEMRRQERLRPRRVKLGRWAATLALSSAATLAVWIQEDGRGFAVVMLIILGLSVLWAIYDIARGPRE